MSRHNFPKHKHHKLKGICHTSAHAQQFDFSSDGTFFKVDICERNPFPSTLHDEACENSNTDIEELLVNHDRFKRHILCLELKTVEKIRCLRKRIFKAARRDESYLQLVYLEEKIEGRRSETLYSCRCGCKLGESKTDKAFNNVNMTNILCKQTSKAGRRINIFERHMKLQANS